MLNKILTDKKLKPILLSFATGFLAYRIGKITPNLLTISLGTWMHSAFYIAPGLFVLLLIALWNPSSQIIRFNRPKLPPAHIIFSKQFFLYFIIICVIGLLLSLWITSGIPTWVMAGHVVFFGSMITMFILGAFKPGLGPLVFFAVYPFLWFAEARANASFYWVLKDLNNIPTWLHNFITEWSNVHIMMLAFAIGFLFFAIKDPKQIEKTKLDIPIILLLIWTLLSVITANDRSVALRCYIWRWIFPVTFYYATFLTMKRGNGVREIKIVLVVLLFFACLFDIQNAARTGVSPWSGEEVLFSGEERAFRWTIVAYQIGPWIVMIYPLALSLLFDRKERNYIRLLSLFAIILGFVMVLWEMNRTVLLCLVLMAALGFIIYHRSWRQQLLVYTTLGVTGLLFYNKIIDLIQLMRPSMLYRNPFGLSHNLDRLYLLEQSWNIIRDNPVLGIGPGGFGLLHLGLYKPEVSSHNILTEVALESGVIPLFIFGIIFFYPIFEHVKSIRYKRNRADIGDLRPFLISFLAYFFLLMLHPVWHHGQGAALFCLLGMFVWSTKKDLNTSVV